MGQSRVISLLILLIIPASLMGAGVSPRASFSSEELEAKAAYVYDVRSKATVYGNSELAQLPLASLTKLMTAYVAYSNLGESEKDNLCQMLVSSDNAIAIGYVAKLAERNVDLIKEMNSYAVNLGMKQTYYINSSGLDESLTLAGAYGSARDQALLLNAINENAPHLLNCTTKSTYSTASSTVNNTNKEVDKTYGILGSKTGFTDLAGGNLGVIVDIDINSPVVLVVLGSSREGRILDVDSLLTSVRRYYSAINK